jgi:Helix-hairpin-helix motif
MNQSVVAGNSVHHTAMPLARLSEPHGYRFEGDTVHLQARFAVLDPAAHHRSWALQLWACPSAPTSTRDLAGQMAAEVALPPMSEAADETEYMDMSAFAYPPAGNGEHFMALVLASGQPGRFNEVHDVAVYPRRQGFLQPGIRGAVGYRIDGDRVQVTVDRIENPRPAGTASGTLALELWALPAPYTGGDFEGVGLAGVEIGSLAGQTESISNSFELPFSAPPSGAWHFVLMLREWTAAGFIARDFTNFTSPVIYAPVPAAAPIPFAAPQIPAPAPAAKTRKSKAKPAAPAVAVPTKTVPATRAVSINTASAERLAAVDGLTLKLAQGIIKKRPFASLDDLRKVKGISVSLLARIRSRLKP